MYLDRIVDAEVPVALGSAGAVLIEGPKGCGKTWTGQRFAHSEILLEERPDLWDIASQVPELLLDGATPRLLDEWQRVPELWHLMRVECDRRGRPGQFILTGSAVPADEMTRHSGAGRVSRVRMRPMSLAESGPSEPVVSLGGLLEGQAFTAGESPVDVKTLVEAACRGGWPRLIGAPITAARRFTRDYLSDICRVDISAVDGISRSPTGVMRLLQSLARNVATTAGCRKLASETGGDVPVGRTTAKTYLDALSRLFVVEDLPAWNTHLRSRTSLIRSPKRHFVDPSLAPAALGVGPERYLSDLEAFGFLLESMVVRDLRIYAQANDASVYHYRDTYGLEADAIVETGDGRWIAVETKLGGTSTVEKAAAALLKLRDRVSRERAATLARLMVITGGRYCYQRPDGVAVVPLACLGP
ncbi:MAG: ATP-binding protein [Acidimicrobiia bacterium]|nr:ATP-binding protein [Acidimicrobiia bacterium]